MIYFFILLCGLLNCEVGASNNLITLQNRNHITCAYSDICSTIGTIPPVEQSANPDSLLLNEIWHFNDSWNDVDSRKSLQAPVTDKRWEGLSIFKTEHYNFSSGNSIAFSVYSTASFKIYLRGSNKFKHYDLPENEQYLQWIHYNIISINNKVYCMENSHIIRKIEGMHIDQITVASNKNFYLKLHDYSFKVSKTITKEKPAQITIPPSGKGKSCFLLYYSFCKECYLELEISNGEHVTRKTFNHHNELWPITKSWEQSAVEIDTDNESQIRIFRRHEQNRENGYWALDLRSCPDVENDMGIYRVEAFGAPVERTCQILNNRFDKNSQLDNITEKPTTAICSEPGKLGNDCNISCRRILGDKFPFCEQQRICENSICTCSLGYQGTFCQERCPKGSWGLSCQKSCKNNCEVCEGKTGECLEKSTASIVSPNMDLPIKIVIMILLVIIILVIGLIGLIYWAYRTINRSRRYSLYSASNDNRQSDVTGMKYQSSQILIT